MSVSTWQSQHYTQVNIQITKFVYECVLEGKKQRCLHDYHASLFCNSPDQFLSSGKGGCCFQKLLNFLWFVQDTEKVASSAKCGVKTEYGY